MKILNLMGLGLATAAAAQTSDDGAQFGIFAETREVQFMGVKPGVLPKVGPGNSVPDTTVAMVSGAAKKTLAFRLWTPGLAPGSASAVLIPPSGLKLGPQVNLGLYRPPSAESRPAEPGPERLFVKVYWGSSPTVEPGQPKVLEMKSLSVPQQMALAGHLWMSPAMLLSGASNGDFYYRDGWTTSYWPGASDPGVLPGSASLAGTFSLRTNFVGNASLSVPSGVSFLPPITMLSPDRGSAIDFSRPLEFKWNPVAGGIGQYATIFGVEGRNTLIIWSSSEVFADELLADLSYTPARDVEEKVGRKLFMPGAVASMTVPGGIFQNADFSVLNMAVYGPGFAEKGGHLAPSIQTDSTLTLMLGGKNGTRPSIGDNG